MTVNGGAGAFERPLTTELQNLAIIGTGLMGGSLGLACLERRIVRSVSGYDIDRKTCEQALRIGAITSAASTIEQAVQDADLVVLATPVRVIPEAFESIAGHLRQGTIVTDVGSTKGRLVEQISSLAPAGVHFIGGHPVAGSEREGIDAAVADLYAGCFWILTPTSDTDTDAYRALMRFLGKLDARVLSLNPDRHDEALALSSHLPQLLATTLMNFVSESASPEERIPLLAAGGFLDMTRIAASSPRLWVDIVRENSTAVVKALQGFTAALQEAEKKLSGQEWESLNKLLGRARQARKSLPGKPGVKVAELVDIRIPVPDRAGVLAEVATTIGAAGINIEDMDIVHSPEGGRGVIYLTVSGRKVALDALEAIKQKGYRPEID